MRFPWSRQQAAELVTLEYRLGAVFGACGNDDSGGEGSGTGEGDPGGDTHGGADDMGTEGGSP